MRTLINNFLTALVILAIAFFSSCQSNEAKLDSAKENVEEVKDELAEAKQDVREATAKVASAEEWRIFKSDAEAKIKINEVRIGELKVKLNKPGKTFDEMYAKNIESLEVKNKDLKTRIGAYESNQSDWDSFTREFNHDMDELGQALKDLTVNNKN